MGPQQAIATEGCQTCEQLFVAHGQTREFIAQSLEQLIDRGSAIGARQQPVFDQADSVALTRHRIKHVPTSRVDLLKPQVATTLQARMFVGTSKFVGTQWKGMECLACHVVCLSFRIILFSRWPTLSIRFSRF